MELLFYAFLGFIVLGIVGRFSDRVALKRCWWALKFGFVIGGISFLCGFFGPIIFMPSSNQGPLLGIFITGPLGFLVGCVIGLIVTRNRTK